MHLLTVDHSAVGTRLDLFLREQFPQLSRRSAQEAIAAGDVRVNHRRVRKGIILREGDTVELAESRIAPQQLAANADLDVSVLYEDEAVVAVNKPAGMPSHALRSHETCTVANFLIAHYSEMRSVGAPPLEAGLVHRLDTNTSGVLLAARNPAAFDHLRRQFREHSVTKEYAAVVVGDVAQPGDIRVALQHSGNDRGKMRVLRAGDSDAKGRAAITLYRPRERYGTETLLTVHIQTGVMHQIRAHLAWIGHPVVGDELYGLSAPTASRHLLHAARLIVTHPATGERLSISCPLAADIETHLRQLRKNRGGTRSSQRTVRH